MTFEDDKGAYDQKDAEGFIRLNALRLRTLGMRRKKFDKIDAPHLAARSCVAGRAGRAMRNLIGKIALTTGSALIAGGLLVIAYLSAGTFILAGILAAVFLIGEKIDVVQYVFAPIAFSAAIIFAAASWALTALGVGTWWVWKKTPRDDRPPQV